jgi:YD repeat-containing protein
MTTAADPDGTYTMTCDGLGRVTNVDAPFGQAMSFEHNLAGRRTRVADSQGGVTTSTVSVRRVLQLSTSCPLSS